MTHWKLMFPSDFLGAPDLREKDVTLTIRAIVREELSTSSGKRMKWTMYFEETQAKAEKAKETEKKMIINITNGASIAAMYGKEREDWIGKKVTFYPTTCRGVEGKDVDCVRVRAGVPA